MEILSRDNIYAFTQGVYAHEVYSRWTKDDKWISVFRVLKENCWGIYTENYTLNFKKNKNISHKRLGYICKQIKNMRLYDI